MKTLHFEIGHVLNSRALPGEGHSKRFDQSNVLRPLHYFSPDLQGTNLRILERACRYAHCSEEFFLINVNARSGWLRTVIGHAQIDRDITCWIASESNEFDSDIIIQSNILPYDSYWSNLEELSVVGMECELGNPRSEVMNVAEGNDKRMKRIAKGDAQGVWQITLKGGQFIGKTGTAEFIQAELCILNRIEGHPHIVYFFHHDCDEAEELCEETLCTRCEEVREAGEEMTSQLCQACGKSRISAYFMEFMPFDLKSFILDRKREFGEKPPFEPEDAVEILLQIAKAMKHIHDEEVVHCDMKPANILISEIQTGDEEKQYLVKVADFGSAKRVIGTANFIAGPGTTAYTSPEALEQRKDDKLRIEFPYRIDVYSFGIVAFEVLTGDIKHVIDSVKNPKLFKANVLKGERPELTKGKFDEGLISLVKRCWHEQPSKRPTFATVCEELVKVGAQRDVVKRGDNPAKQAKLSNGSASVCDQVGQKASALVHIGARTKKPSGISKAFQFSKIKTKVRNIGCFNPGVKDLDEHSS